MKTLILAGGRGVRLRPLTYSIPKPLLPIGEKPILEEIIERLRAQGLREFVVAVGYRAELIETYFRDGAQLGVRIEYVREAEPLGTAGPLSLVRDHCALPPDQPLLVMNGDILTDLDMSALATAHRTSGVALTVATRDFTLQHPYGVLQIVDGKVTSIREKPAVTDTVSAGVYALDTAALKYVPAGTFFDMPDLINALVAAGETVGAYAFDGAWLAIDGLDQLEDATRIVAESNA
jgi:NDP-sugar pyrophosphorylase family protein